MSSPTTYDLIDSARHRLIVDRRRLDAAQLAELAALPDSDIPALAALAHEVRLAWCGDTEEVELAVNSRYRGT